MISWNLAQIIEYVREYGQIGLWAFDEYFPSVVSDYQGIRVSEGHVKNTFPGSSTCPWDTNFWVQSMWISKSSSGVILFYTKGDEPQDLSSEVGPQISSDGVTWVFITTADSQVAS